MRTRPLSFIISCLVLYGAFSYTGYRIFMVALVVLLLLALAALAELFWIRGRLFLSQTLEPDPVYTQDAANLVIEIISKTRLPVALLEIVTEQKRADALRSACELVPDWQDERRAAARVRSMMTERPPRLTLKALRSQVIESVRRFPELAKRTLTREWNRLLCELRLVRRPSGQTVQVILRNRHQTSLIGRGKFREVIRMRTDDARIYEVSACQVSIQDPFGIFRLRLRCLVSGDREGLRLHVLPRPDEKLLAQAWLQSSRDGFNPSQRMSDEVNAIADLHQMNPGDSPKRIHWIISAKQNQWMIKRFEKDEQAHVLLLPDLGSGPVSERLQALRRDAVLGLTSAAVQQMLQTDLSVLLVTSDLSMRYSYAARNDQLLDLLIHLAAAPDQSDDPLRHQALEGLARLPEDAMVVFVSATPDDALVALSADLINTGHRVIMIYYENPLLGAREHALQLDRLSGFGVNLIRIRETDPARLRHPERLHSARRSADGWRQVRREASS